MANRRGEDLDQIDIAILRETPEDLAASLARRGLDIDLDALTDLAAEHVAAGRNLEEVCVAADAGADDCIELYIFFKIT